MVEIWGVKLPEMYVRELTLNDPLTNVSISKVKRESVKREPDR